MIPKKPIIDFGIVTAIECERKALLDRLENVDRVRGTPPDIRDYWRAQLTTPNRTVYQLAVVQCTQAGNSDAGQASKDLILRWEPSRLFMVGVAGGFPRGDAKIGDVVVATEIVEYDYKRFHDNDWNARPRHHRCCPTLLAKLTSLPVWNAQDVPIPPGYMQEGWLPKMQKPGPIAAGNALFADERARDRLLELQQDLIAVEMESEGLAVAAWQRDPPVPFFVIRGICDLADAKTKGNGSFCRASHRTDREKQKELCQITAANSAASFLVHLLFDQPVFPKNNSKNYSWEQVAETALWSIKINGNGPIDFAGLEKVLREISGDYTITIKRHRPGSIIVDFHGALAGFQRIRQLFERGDLETLLGLEILDVYLTANEKVEGKVINDISGKKPLFNYGERIPLKDQSRFQKSAPRSQAIEHSSVRLSTVDGRVAGLGVIVTGRQILTCAHVVDQALLRQKSEWSHRPSPDIAISFDFPLVAPGKICKAHVVRWSSVGNDDVATLQVHEDANLPTVVSPVSLIPPPETMWGTKVRTFGFPDQIEDGVWAEGELRSHNVKGWVQIDHSNIAGYSMSRGFSGTPVWDDNKKGVIGIIVATDNRPGIKSSFMIPSTVLGGKLLFEQDRGSAAWSLTFLQSDTLSALLNDLLVLERSGLTDTECERLQVVLSQLSKLASNERNALWGGVIAENFEELEYLYRDWNSHAGPEAANHRRNTLREMRKTRHQLAKRIRLFRGFLSSELDVQLVDNVYSAIEDLCKKYPDKFPSLRKSARVFRKRKQQARHPN